VKEKMIDAYVKL